MISDELDVKMIWPWSAVIVSVAISGAVAYMMPMASIAEMVTAAFILVLAIPTALILLHMRIYDIVQLLGFSINEDDKIGSRDIQRRVSLLTTVMVCSQLWGVIESQGVMGLLAVVAGASIFYPVLLHLFYRSNWPFP